MCKLELLSSRVAMVGYCYCCWCPATGCCGSVAVRCGSVTGCQGSLAVLSHTGHRWRMGHELSLSL